MPCLRSKPKQKPEYLAFMSSQKRSKPAPQTDRRLSDSSAIFNNSKNSAATDKTACGIDNSMKVTTTAGAWGTNISKNLAITTTITAVNKTAITTNIKPTTTQAIKQPSKTTKPRGTTRPTLPYALPYRQHHVASRPYCSQTPSPPPPTRSQQLTLNKAERKHRAELARLHRGMGIYSWCGPATGKNGKGKARGLHPDVMHRFVDDRVVGLVTKEEREWEREALRKLGIVIEGL